MIKTRNILIIDDHFYLYEGVRSRVNEIFPLAKCQYSDNIIESLSIITNESIDLVICDLEFNNNTKFDGFYFKEYSAITNPNLKVIAFTNYKSYRVMNKVRKYGFNSFLLKTATFQEFMDTLQGVSKTEEEYISESMKEIMKTRNEFKSSIYSDSLYGLNDLSKQELDLVIRSSETTDRNKLAKIMFKSPHTIDSYFQHIYKKIHVKSKLEVQFFAIEFMEELLKESKKKNQ